jgi:hypothetical protein
MKKTAGLALLLALPIELVNFYVIGFPLDIGYPDDAPWYIKLLGLEWVLLHYIGLFLMDPFEKLTGCHDGNVVAGCVRVDTAVLLAGGYLATVLVVFALIYAGQQMVRLFRHRAAQ